MKNSMSFQFSGHPFVPAVAALVLYGKLIDPRDDKSVSEALDTLVMTYNGQIMLRLVSESDAVAIIASKSNKNSPLLDAEIRFAAQAFLESEGGLVGLEHTIQTCRKTNANKAMATFDGAVEKDDPNVKVHAFTVTPDGKIMGDMDALPEDIRQFVHKIAKNHADKNAEETE